jgi:hypothetical protein
MASYICIWDAFSGLECDRIKQTKRLKAALCKICVGIESKPQNPEYISWGVDQELKMGTHVMISARGHCPICRLVLGLVDMKAVGTGNGREFYEKSSYQARIMSDPDGPYIQIRTDNEGPTTYIGSIRLMNPENPLLNPYQQCQKLSGFRSTAPHSDGHQRIDEEVVKSEEQVSFRLLRQWLRTCEKQHGVLCNEPRSKDHENLKLLLIDAVDRRLIEGDSSYRYFAISYVWGSVQMLQTTMENIEQLKSPGALKTVGGAMPAMPRVLADAMELLLHLGERYLWADCLCIVQNDYAQKHLLIQQMDRVYSNAFATIAAVAGEDADCGLPGVLRTPRSPYVLAGFFGHHFVATLEDSQDGVFGVLSSSTYDCRAWTFQERLMSRRCLYFAKDQVYFQCSKGISSDVCLYDNFGMDGRITEINPLVNLKTQNWYNIYIELVKMYTRRRMLFAEDALNAFSGIMSLLENEFQIKFIMGLPNHEFAHCLLWKRSSNSESLVRRKLEGDGYQFPSWCWAGWEGQVKFFLSRQSSSDEKLRELDWQPLQSFDSASQVASDNISQQLQARVTQESPVHYSRDLRFLSIKSSVVHPSKFKFKKEIDNESGFFITDNSGRICGLLFIDFITDLASLNELDPDYQPLQELLLVSTLVDADSEYIELGWSVEGLDEEYSEAGFSTFLVIEWEGKYAERIGMGYVGTNAWERAQPCFKEVVLG